MQKVSKCAARLTKDDSDNPWTEMTGRPCIETEGAPTAADNDSCTMDEIGVRMGWITEAKASGEIEAEAEVPDTRAGAEATVGEDVTVIVEHDEDTTGNEFSKLFFVRRGGMVNDEASGPNRHKKIKQKGPNTRGSNNPANWSQINEQKAKKQQGNSKQATRAKLRGNGLNVHAQRDHLLTTGNLPVNYDYW